MQHLLSSLLLVTTLVGAPIAASADPVADDRARYAEIEKQSPAAATFEGGGSGIYIGGSALTIVLVILLILVIL